MSASHRREKISEAVLTLLQELLRNVKDRRESVVMSEEMYVELRDRPSPAIPTGAVLAKWNVTRQEIAALQASAPRPGHVATGDSCYRTAWGEFAIGEDEATVTISFKFSPKFGRGDVYRVVMDEGQRVSLQRMKPAWSL